MTTSRNVTTGQLHALLRAMDSREGALRELIARQRDAVELGDQAGEPQGDDADQAQARERKTIGNDLLEIYLTELAEIRAARERAAEGTYGSCVDCGSPIDARRLRAQPAARRCLACQALRERMFAGAT